MVFEKGLNKLSQTSGNNLNDITEQSSDSLPLDQLIVWQKPNIEGTSTQYTRSQVAKWIRDSIGKFGRVDTLRFCESCDSALLLLAGPGVRLYLEGGAATGGKNSAGVPSSGGNGPCWVSMNFPASGKPIQITDGIEKTVSLGTKTRKKIKVAVLDEGDNSKIRNNYPFNPFTSPAPCIIGAERGWNFVAHNSDTHDDGIHEKHGADVTSYITERVEKYLQNDVEILTAKTHNKDQIAYLFDICCAMAYAARREVKIMNFSFGFYMARHPKYPINQDRDVVLYKEYIKYFTTRKKILVVAAAGNMDKVNQQAAFNLRNIPYPANDRDLRNFYFFPASIKEIPDFWNVIPVTTVDIPTSKVDPTQNYSPNIVYGVQAQGLSTTTFYNGLPIQLFNNPRLNGTQTNGGSSFATAVATGTFCANYFKIEGIINGPTPTTTAILNQLGPQIVTSSPALSLKIKDGKVLKLQ